MTRPPQSIPDIAERLMGEFEGALSPAEITSVVMRLSRDGALRLSMLLDLARAELDLLAPVEPLRGPVA